MNRRNRIGIFFIAAGVSFATLFAFAGEKYHGRMNHRFKKEACMNGQKGNPENSDKGLNRNNSEK